MISLSVYVCYQWNSIWPIQYCINIFSFLACRCNSKGTLSNRNTLYIYQQDNATCNNDSCTCNSGYSGSDCNLCDNGYMVTATENGENTCEPGENAIKILN